MLLYVQLFFEYFKIGLLSIGGGLATLPFLHDLMIKTGWFTMDDLSHLIAVSESTPGPLGVNMATYVGNITGGIPGSIIATLGLVSPAMIIIIVIAHFLKKFKDSKLVQHALYGLRPASMGLITVALCSIASISVFRWDNFQQTGLYSDLFPIKAILLAIALYIGLKKFKKHPILYIGISALCGIIFSF